MQMTDLLPDSRMGRPVGAVSGPDGYWIPIYCGNCGVKGGLVPEENCTFAFWLCRACEAHGNAAHFLQTPDEIFFQKVAEEQLDKYARLLGLEEILKILDDPTHPLTRLARERFSSKG